MADLPTIIAAVVYLAGFSSASVIVWRGSNGYAGFPGLLVAILWPVWLPMFGALRGWRFGK